MIKKYLYFFFENFKDFSSKTYFILSKAKDDEYVRQIIGEYTKDLSPNVDIKSSLNTLDEHTKDLIIKMIEDYESEKKYPNEVIATPSTTINYNESSQVGGKNLFSCFLKVVSALGQKDSVIDWNITPDNYIGLFVSGVVSTDDLSGVLSRYLYFDDYLKTKDIQHKYSKLYWGIKTDMNVEYGLFLNNQPHTLGSFLLTQGTYNYIMTLNFKSANNLKKLLVDLDLNKLSIISKVKEVMKSFFPGQSDSKSKPTINGDVISYGFQNLGKWDNNQIDPSEIENVKNNLRTFLMQYKWSDKIQISVQPSNNWIFVNIKIK